MKGLFLNVKSLAMIGNNVFIFLSGPHPTCNFKPLLYSSVYITFLHQNKLLHTFYKNIDKAFN